MAPGTMNLTELQEKSDKIAKLLEQLEEGRDPMEDGEADSISPNASKERINAALLRENTSATEEGDTEDKKRTSGTIQSIKTHPQGAQSSVQFDDAEDDADEFEDDVGDDFLNFDPSDLGGGFESLNVAGSKRMIDTLFTRLKTKDKLAVTASISTWFDSAKVACNESERELDLHEAECDNEFNNLEETSEHLFGNVDVRDLNCIQFIRSFYNKVLSLRPEEVAKKKRKEELAKKKRDGFTMNTVASEEEKLRAKEERRLRLLKEMKEGGLRQKIKKLKSGIGDEEGEEEEEEEEEVCLETATSPKSVAKAKVNESPRHGDKQQTAQPAKPAMPVIKQSEIASELLEVISAQQEEIANYRSRQDVDAKTNESLKEALEFMRTERESEDAELMGNQAKKNKKAVMGDGAKELLDDVMEQMRVKCIADMLVTPEGRELLEKSAGEGKSKILEAHKRHAALVKEAEALKRQVDELHELIESVGERGEREEHLRVEIAAAKEAKEEQAQETQKENEGAPGRAAAGTNADSPSKTAEAADGTKTKKKNKHKTKGKFSTHKAADEEPESTGEADAGISEGDLGAPPGPAAAVGGEIQPLRVPSPPTPPEPVLVVIPPASGWLKTQGQESQIQVQGVVRNMEKQMDNIGSMKDKFHTVLEDVLESMVDEALQEEERVLNGGLVAVEFDAVKTLEIDLLKETVKTNRETLDEVRNTNYRLQEQELDQKQTMRRLKKMLKGEEEEETKRRVTRSSSIRELQASSGGRRRMSGSGGGLGNGQAGGRRTSRSSIMQRGADVEVKEMPMSNDIHEVRGQVRIMKKEVDALQKREAQIKQKMEIILNSGGFFVAADSMAHAASDECSSDGALLGPNNGTVGEVIGTLAASKQFVNKLKGGVANTTGSQVEIQRSVTAPAASKGGHGGCDHGGHDGGGHSGHGGGGDVGDGGHDGGGHGGRGDGGGGHGGGGHGGDGSDGHDESFHTNSTQHEADREANSTAMRRVLVQDGGAAGGAPPPAALSGGAGPHDAGDGTGDGELLKRDPRKRSSKRLSKKNVANSLQNTSDAHGDAEKSKADGDAEKSKPDGAKSRLSSAALVKDGASVVVGKNEKREVIDKREAQIKDLLFLQSEHERLNNQIAGIEKQIKEAKIRMLHPGGENKTVNAASVKDVTVPEENRAMRREVLRKQRELNDLRKRWHIESDKHKKGAYDGTIPGQVEAAVRLLLRDPPKESAVKAKAEEEAVKRAQEEAAKLAEDVDSDSSADKKVKDTTQDGAEKVEKRPSSEGQEGLAIGSDSLAHSRPQGITRRNSRLSTGPAGLSRASIQSQISQFEVMKRKRESASTQSSDGDVASLLNESVTQIGRVSNSSGESRSSVLSGKPVPRVLQHRPSLLMVDQIALQGWHAVAVPGEVQDDSGLVVSGSGNNQQNRKSFGRRDRRAQTEKLTLNLAGHHIDTEGHRPTDQYEHVVRSMTQPHGLGMTVTASDSGPQRHRRSVLFAGNDAPIEIAGQDQGAAGAPAQRARRSDAIHGVFQSGHQGAPLGQQAEPAPIGSRREAALNQVASGPRAGWARVKPQLQKVREIGQGASSDDEGSSNYGSEEAPTMAPTKSLPRDSESGFGATNAAVNALKSRLKTAGWAQQTIREEE